MNNPFGITEKSYNIILNIFNNYPNINEVIIYGSRATGNYKSSSDIDLIIKSSTLSFTELSKIKNDLYNSPIPYTIDLAIYENLTNSALLQEVDRFGKLFYKKP